ncbi:MAG: hypothetical protein F6K55_03755 [Moorea sp. SIO4A3]|nr:hypothetical protein [Moorena sp. SIO4A3]
MRNNRTREQQRQYISEQIEAGNIKDLAIDEAVAIARTYIPNAKDSIEEGYELLKLTNPVWDGYTFVFEDEGNRWFKSFELSTFSFHVVCYSKVPKFPLKDSKKVTVYVRDLKQRVCIGETYFLTIGEVEYFCKSRIHLKK